MGGHGSQAHEPTDEEKRARAFAAGVFALVGLFAAVVGAHDAFGAYEVGSRFGGLLLLLAGSAVVATAVALLIWSLDWAPTAGIFASALGAMLGTSFIIAQLLNPDRSWPPFVTAVVISVLTLFAGILLHWKPNRLFAFSGPLLLFFYLGYRRGDYDERLIIWAAIVFASVIVAYSLWRVRPPVLSMSGAGQAKLFAGIFGFFSLSALIGGAQFWYTSQYLPSSEGASASITTALHQIGRLGHMDVVELKMTAENTGQIRAQILGSVYRVDGAPMIPVRRTDTRMVRLLGRPDVRGGGVSRFRRGPSWEVVQAGRIFSDGWSLDPEEKFSKSVLIYVPRGDYDALRAQAELMMAKGSSLTLNERDRSRYAGILDESGAKVVVTSWPVRETSWFRDLTRGNREVSLMWVIDSDRQPHSAQFPHLLNTVGRIGEEASPSEYNEYNEQTGRLYGLASTVSTSELALDLRP